jgi:enterochelin esterase-like enzyme
MFDHVQSAPSATRWWKRLGPLGVALVAFPVIGGIGLYRYLDNFWLYRGFAPPKDPAWVKAQGHQEWIQVKSPALGGRSQQVLVYLPPGYDSNPQRRYPVLYLLHGFPGRPLAMLETLRTGVVEDELVAEGKMQPLILVIPNGSTGFFDDKEWANGIHPGQGWETFVARDVVRAVDRRYRTIATGAGRAIAGLSEGGYGSLNIGFHHPGLFRVLESWSGYMRADPILSIFGRSPQRLAYNSPSSYLPQVAPALRRAYVHIWFYTGNKDTLLGQNRRFDRLLKQYRIPHTFFIARGGHTWTIWRNETPAALRTAAALLAHG